MEFAIYNQILGVFKLKHNKRARKETKWIVHKNKFAVFLNAYYVIFNTRDVMIK